jgi:pimeloyl-ACP methyl ester carboxylesterase
LVRRTGYGYTGAREWMESTMPDIEAVVVEGTGHMIPQDRPEEFERFIRVFLERVYRDSS